MTVGGYEGIETLFGFGCMPDPAGTAIGGKKVVTTG
jgi:hypothetical protein